MGLHPDVDFGDEVQDKHTDMVRLAYGNINGFQATIINNSKVLVLHRWLWKYDVDGFFGVESNLNWKKMPPHGGLDEFFHSEMAMQTVASYNTHDNFGQNSKGYVWFGIWKLGIHSTKSWDR